MMVYRDGFVPLTTHLFPADSPYLDSDAVFGVRDSLIVPFTRHEPGTAPDGRVLDRAVPHHAVRHPLSRRPPEATAP